MTLPKARQLFMTRFADPTDANQRKIDAINEQIDVLQQPEMTTIWDEARANAGMFMDQVLAPGRGLEARWHEGFQGVED